MRCKGTHAIQHQFVKPQIDQDRSLPWTFALLAPRAARLVLITIRVRLHLAFRIESLLGRPPERLLGFASFDNRQFLGGQGAVSVALS